MANTTTKSYGVGWVGKDLVPISQEAGWAPGPVWTVGKSRPHRDSIPDRRSRSQSLYQLSYPSHVYGKYKHEIVWDGVGWSSRMSTQTFQIFILNYSKKLFTFHCTAHPLYCHVVPVTINIVGRPFQFPVDISPRSVRSQHTFCITRQLRADTASRTNSEIQSTNTNAIKTTHDSPRQQNCNLVCITSFL